MDEASLISNAVNMGVAVVIAVYLVYKVSNDFQQRLDKLVDRIDNLTNQLAKKFDEIISEERNFRREIIDKLLGDRK